MNTTQKKHWNKKRKLANCEKVKKSGYVCLFSI